MHFFGWSSFFETSWIFGNISKATQYFILAASRPISLQHFFKEFRKSETSIFHTLSLTFLSRFSFFEMQWFYFPSLEICSIAFLGNVFLWICWICLEFNYSWFRAHTAPQPNLVHALLNSRLPTLYPLIPLPHFWYVWIHLNISTSNNLMNFLVN